MQTIILILIARMVYAILTYDMRPFIDPFAFVYFLSFASLIAVAHSAQSIAPTFTYKGNQS